MATELVHIARCPEHGLHGERGECFVCAGPVERVAMLPVPYFSDLGDVGPVHFQGGVIWLAGYGCSRCGNGHWTEADDKRRHTPGELATCPHCGGQSVVPDA